MINSLLFSLLLLPTTTTTIGWVHTNHEFGRIVSRSENSYLSVEEPNDRRDGLLKLIEEHLHYIRDNQCLTPAP